jgi:tRNA nucleotidyltransferase (CCA-adding enzyme)
MRHDSYNLSKSAEKKLHDLVKEVIPEVKPSKKEIDDAKFAINEIMGRLMRKTPKEVEILLAGSVARGTQIRGNSDIDVFLLFPRKMKEKMIEKKGMEIAKSIVNRKNNESYIVKYAEHPYTRLLLKDLNINVDVVPAYKIEHANERGTAVDRTQLHNEFVNSKLNERQRDDVRALKAFLDSHNIYGAEARIEGFSGYLCELLVHHYGSFKDAIVGIANIELPLVINFKKPKAVEQDQKSLLKTFGKRFIVIDPTDDNRNVAANVSDESLLRFMLISRALIKSPNKLAFYGGGQSDVYSERRLLGIKSILGVDIYVLHFTVPDIAEDIIWQQVKKTRLRLHEFLKSNRFEPMLSLQNVDGKSAVIGLFVPNVHFATRVIIGPSLDMGKSIEQFKNAHKNSLLVSIDNGRIYVIEKSRYPNPESAIRGFVNDRHTKLPSNLSAKRSSLYVNKIPEEYAKLIYRAYTEKFTI